MSDLEEILVSLYASAISVSISWIWDGDIDVKLGDPLNGYKAEDTTMSRRARRGDTVGTVTEVAEWLRDQAVRHYPSSEFARQFAAR
jgi:hypothetical protein